MAKRSSKKDKKIITVVVICAAVLIALITRISDGTWDKLYKDSGVNSPPAVSGDVSVHFVDVGQGDCTVIYSKEYGVTVIDTGEADKAQTVINYLRSLGVDKINYCIMTHPHSDHMGSMAEVLSEFHADKLIMPKLSEINIPTTKTYEKFLLSARENADEIIAAEAGSTYSMGDIQLNILGPCRQDEDLNNMSVVVKAEYGETSFLITGDCSFDEEESIMQNSYSSLKSNVLKIGHHGSAGATSSEWLEAVSPEAGVISVGAGNSYSHPNQKLIKRLDDYGLTYYRTDLLGTVIFETDGKNVSYKGK